MIGLDASETASVIASDPFLLNRLPYTLAVIKEVLRMFHAVSGTRAGEHNFSIIDDLGAISLQAAFLSGITHKLYIEILLTSLDLTNLYRTLACGAW